MSLPFELHDLTRERAATALLYLAGPGYVVDVRFTSGHAIRYLAPSTEAGVGLARDQATAVGDTVVVFLLHHGVLPRRCSA